MCIIRSRHKRMGKEITMVRKANIVEVQGLAGGKGIAEMHHIGGRRRICMDTEECMPK